MYSASYFCRTLIIKFLISRQILTKVPNIMGIRPVAAAPIHADSLIPFQLKRAHLGQFNVAGRNDTYIGLYVKCPIFLPNFNQI
jgi:hypothetical protein